jgi:hypothetical protein
MGLTRPRASQIYNLDYKQATRVVTTTNIALAGGTPSQVDGVSLVLKDRILVTGQSTASQNGIYYVTTVGSGSNGTWARSTDTNQTGELDAGTIVMVTEGVTYKDTQWKLITDNPIIIGTTPLEFTQNYSANSISGGTSNVTVFSNANVTISSANVANVLTVANDGTYVVGVVSATGNIVGNYILGNGSQLSGLVVDAGSFISNGNSNVVITANSNITIGVSNSVISTFTSDGQITTGVISATGNITGDYILGNGSQLSGTYGNTNVTTLLANFGSNSISTTGNITAANLNSSNADLAEMYVADEDYAPGTVVEFGGKFEITASIQTHSPRVAGVVSTDPSYLMNSAQEGKYVLPIALTGRVPCRVVGTIFKGDRLVASSILGIATALDKNLYEPGCIIGKALEDYNSIDNGVIEIAVGRY